LNARGRTDPTTNRTVPASTASNVKASRVNVGFGEVLRPQIAEAI
jgi:hypothetical protein